MNKISMSKNYITESGNPVRIISVDRKSIDYPVVALVSIKGGKEEIVAYTADGRYMAGLNSTSANDLVKVGKYDHLKVDDKVLVWNCDLDSKVKRYFAGVNVIGMPLTFTEGATSWSSTDRVAWKNCVKVYPSFS